MGLPAPLLANNLDLHSLRVNSPLPTSLWTSYDTTVMDVFTSENVGVMDLVSRGLTVQIDRLSSVFSIYFQSS